MEAKKMLGFKFVGRGDANVNLNGCVAGLTRLNLDKSQVQFSRVVSDNGVVDVNNLMLRSALQSQGDAQFGERLIVSGELADKSWYKDVIGIRYGVFSWDEIVSGEAREDQLQSVRMPTLMSVFSHGSDVQTFSLEMPLGFTFDSFRFVRLVFDFRNGESQALDLCLASEGLTRGAEFMNSMVGAASNSLHI